MKKQSGQIGQQFEISIRKLQDSLFNYLEKDPSIQSHFPPQAIKWIKLKDVFKAPVLKSLNYKGKNINVMRGTE